MRVPGCVPVQVEDNVVNPRKRRHLVSRLAKASVHAREVRPAP